jgi:PAS domain S-box-containing protein
MTGVISTNPARCRDCYRCVRTCPVKAVRVSGGQAEIVADLCIACASCVRACPQGAKVVRDDLPSILSARAAGRQLVASVAPSAPAYFAMQSFDQMDAALLQLGFTASGETAVGAEMVGQMHGDLIRAQNEPFPLIATSCPVVVSLVEQYYPDLIPNLAPVVSPMIAHGRYLRQKYGPLAFVVFIGPCIAKKGEIRDPNVAGAVDAVLTYAELESWLAAEKICFPSAADVSESAPEIEPSENLEMRRAARLFPVEGGLIGTARLDTDMLSTGVLTGSGIGTCENVLLGIRTGELQSSLVELMACGGGCINGPALMDRSSVALSRQRLMRYAAHKSPHPSVPRSEWPSLTRQYSDRHIPVPEYTEDQIKEVLRLVDKYSPQDELNCGSCGYPSCRDKAIATLRGMAEATMCIPYMRARAESLNNVVMDVTPNAILVIDGQLRVQDMSPSAAQMFCCQRTSARGRPLIEIIPVVDDFVSVLTTGQPVTNKVSRLRSDLVVEASIVPEGGQNRIVAILRDVTEREQQRNELERLRAETLQRSQEVINKQMRVAHEIAGLLGETTAETKILLMQLAHLIQQNPKEGRDE